MIAWILSALEHEKGCFLGAGAIFSLDCSLALSSQGPAMRCLCLAGE